MAPARSRLPTYGAAGRLARIVIGLVSRPHGWPLAAITAELGISERTLLRYLAVCRNELVDASGKPMIEVVGQGGERALKLVDAGPAPDAGVFEAVFFYFTQTVLTFLEGTVLKDGVAGLWERLHRGLPPRQRTRLVNLGKKFYAVPFAAKDYRSHDEQLDLVVRCLIDQHRMRVDYQGLVGEGKVHDFDPYTLVHYRGGLYLIGYSHRYRKNIWLAVERIRSVTKLPYRFDYPAGYSPEKYTEGMFGIIAGPETTVELLLRGKETAAFLASRRLHPTQRFTTRADGATLLTMKVRGTTELSSWILSQAPWVEVVKPAALRDEVAARLRAGAALYEARERSRLPGPAESSRRRKIRNPG